MNSTDCHASVVASDGAPRRVDLYASAHATLRQLMTRAMWRMGSVDASDPNQLAEALQQLAQPTGAVHEHLKRENDYLHTAIEARCPGGARHNAAQHAARLEATRGLEDECRALRVAAPEQRSTLARRLYRHLSTFTEVGHQHMREVEQRHNALLWSLYDDTELIEIRQRMYGAGRLR